MLSPLFAGAAIAIGFVPTNRCKKRAELSSSNEIFYCKKNHNRLPNADTLLLVGHRTGDVLVMLTPIMPCSIACIAYQPAMPINNSKTVIVIATFYILSREALAKCAIKNI